MLLVLRSAFFHANGHEAYVTHRLDAFVKLDSGAAEAVARLADPLTGHLANQTFSQVTAFLAAMSRWIRQTPEWAYHLADRLQDISPDDRQQLRELTARTARKPGGPAVPGPIGRSITR
jgi:hypothetical protein